MLEERQGGQTMQAMPEFCGSCNSALVLARLAGCVVRFYLCGDSRDHQ